ncbi:MAG: peptidoglycan DD-metalloendopeptidase family protein [Elusimicrobia bacterium]|nr:peptidoglycan DD-metalloendopeptidase family protein [Elusimicrobiota bacterium]
MHKQLLIIPLIVVLVITGAGIAHWLRLDYERQHPLLQTQTYTLAAGDTLSSSLKNIVLTGTQSKAVIKTLNSIFDLRKCKVGDHYDIITNKNTGSFVKLVYYASPIITYEVTQDARQNFSSNKFEAALEKKVAALQGSIKTNLYEAMTSSGESPELVLGFADLFSYEIDFLTDPRVDDTFSVVYEKYYAHGNFIKNGQILAARYINSGQEHLAILFEETTGHKDYYSPNGKSLRKAFLRSPLNYRRISSFFTRRRWHPILKIFRPHLGLDYSAPSGTPVATIGDGTVLFAGWEGGFGRFIKIKHPNGYTSTYGHLSKWAKGIKSGIRVSRGQVIGYVGSSGLSTGPHLDFRITQGRQFINFLTLKLPEASAISSQYSTQFEQIKKERLQQLNNN